MWFFKNLFKNKVNQQSQLTQSPINYNANISTGIAFRPGLIESLKDDHKKLFEIYGELITLTTNNEFMKIPSKLGEFKLALQAHVLVENIQFYVYMQQKYKEDSINSEFILDVRREMNSIARTVVDFVKKYQLRVFTNEIKISFTDELNAIGDVLTKRVDFEENQLYTLYVE